MTPSPSQPLDVASTELACTEHLREALDTLRHKGQPSFLSESIPYAKDALSVLKGVVYFQDLHYPELREFYAQCLLKQLKKEPAVACYKEQIGLFAQLNSSTKSMMLRAALPYATHCFT
jgi:hypothetical protein